MFFQLTSFLRSSGSAGLLILILVAGVINVTGQSLDPKINQLVGEISADNLRKHVDTLAGFHSRHIASPTIEQAWKYLEGEFSKHSRLTVRLDKWEQQIRRMDNQTVPLVNVVATLQGTTDPNRIYVVSGHYDSRASQGSDAESRAPGAVDDASGTAAVLELARVMSQYEFEATIVFIAFTAEEVGLLGAAHWAQMARDSGLNVNAMITNDIVGNSQGGGGHQSNLAMRVFSEGVPASETEAQSRLRQSIGGEVDSPARQLARYTKSIGERYVPSFNVELIYRRDRFGRGGDHTAFSRVGYPAVRYSEKYENYFRQHQDIRTEDGVAYGDLPEFYDAEYAAKIVRVNAAVLGSLASAPAPPQNVAIKGAVSYSTTLKWDPVSAPDLRGYRILIRSTESPVWERSIDVGTETMHVLEGIIVDNHFFAVQSVDREGNASLPVFPTSTFRR